MIFAQTKSQKGFQYECEDIFGKIVIDSVNALDGKMLDKIVVAVMKAEAKEGEITDKISFTFEPAPKWRDDEEVDPNTLSASSNESDEK